MRAPWTPESHRHASMDPLRAHWDPDGYLEDGAVSRYLAGKFRVAQAPGFAQWRYVQPHGPLEHEVEVPGCGEGRRVRIPSAAGAVAFSPGQMVSIGQTRQGSVILGRPVDGLIGSSAFADDILEAGAFDDLGIVSVSPRSVIAGTVDEVITITGFGFRAAPLDVLMAGVYLGDETDPDFGEYEADPYVTLHDLTWVSAYSVTILADSLATTPNGYFPGIAWRRG